jgi:hypothetical protein
MKLYRLTALIFSSVLFFPVSCTMGVVGGTQALSRWDARDARYDAIPHEHAYLIALKSGAATSFEPVPLFALAQFKAQNPNAIFRLPVASGKFSFGSGNETITFVATPSGDKTQTIEVTKTGDLRTFFRYDATDTEVIPSYTRLWPRGHFFSAMPFAIIFSTILLIVGSRMRSKAAYP